MEDLSIATSCYIGSLNSFVCIQLRPKTLSRIGPMVVRLLVNNV